MPFTFFAHQAVVLPLKFVRPRFFSGTALVIGSMAPDFEYFIRGAPRGTIGHLWWAQIVLCLPTTLVAVFAIRRIIAEPLFLHLPGAGDLARISSGRSSLVRDATSALIGSTSHCVWDGFTHSYGWFVLRSELLRRPLFEIGDFTVCVYKVLQHGSTISGGAFSIAILFVILDRRRLVEWCDGPELEVTHESRRAFSRAVFATTIAVLALSVATSGHLDSGIESVIRVGMRGIGLSAVGAVLAGLYVRRKMSRSSTRSRPPLRGYSDNT